MNFEQEVIDRLSRLEGMFTAHTDAKCDNCKLNDRFVKTESMVKNGRWVVVVMVGLWLQKFAASLVDSLKN